MSALWWSGLTAFAMVVVACDAPQPLEPRANGLPGPPPTQSRIVSQLGASDVVRWAGGPQGLLALHDGSSIRVYDPDRKLVLAEHDATGEVVTDLSWRNERTLRIRTEGGIVLWDWRTGRARPALASGASELQRFAEVWPSAQIATPGSPTLFGPLVVVTERDVRGEDDRPRTISQFQLHEHAISAAIAGDRVFVTGVEATEVFEDSGKSVGTLPAATYVAPSSDGSLVALEIEIGTRNEVSLCGDNCPTNLLMVHRSGPERHEILVFEATTLQLLAKLPGRSAVFRPGHRELYYLGPRGEKAKAGPTSASLMRWSNEENGGARVLDVPDPPFSGDPNREVGHYASWSSDGDVLLVGSLMWMPGATSLTEIGDGAVTFSPSGDIVLETQESIEVKARDGRTRLRIEVPQGTWSCDVGRRDLAKHPVAFCEQNGAVARISPGKPVLTIPTRVQSSEHTACLLPSFVPKHGTSHDGGMRAVASGDGIDISKSDGTKARRLELGDAVDQLAWSPSSNLIAATGENTKKTLVWNGDSGELLTDVDGRYPRWSRDGSVLYTYFAHTAFAWQPGGRAARALPLSKEDYFPGVWPALEGKFVTASADVLELWDGATGALEAKTMRHDPSAAADFSEYALAVSGDGKQLAILSAHASVIDVYDIATLDQVQSFPGIEVPTRAGLFWHPKRPVVALVAPGVATLVYRLTDARRVWLRALAKGDDCARVAYDDEGHYDGDPDAFSLIAVSLGGDAAASEMVTSGPAFDQHRQPDLLYSFIAGH